MQETLIIERRFNGPRLSGNGGYVGGVMADRFHRAFNTDSAVQVTLRAPIPLERELAMTREGDALMLRDGPRKKRVFLVEGAPECVTSTDKRELLGEFLIQRAELLGRIAGPVLPFGWSCPGRCGLVQGAPLCGPAHLPGDAPGSGPLLWQQVLPTLSMLGVQAAGAYYLFDSPLKMEYNAYLSRLPAIRRRCGLL